MKKFLLSFCFIGTMLMMIVMMQTGSTLKTTAAPLGILDLEFAYNTSRTTAVINSWNQTNNIEAAKINTYWDFLFLVFYAGFLYLACKTIAGRKTDAVAKTGNLIAKGALLAGFFDVVENAGMLLTLNNLGSPAVSFFTTFFSILKWGLVIIAMLYMLTGMLVWAYSKIKY